MALENAAGALPPSLALTLRRAYGKRHGRGNFVYANGDTYTGEWHAGAKHGAGRYRQFSLKCTYGVLARLDPTTCGFAVQPCPHICLVPRDHGRAKPKAAH